jgi:hypothetical protein
MGQQEVLSEGTIGTKVAFKGLVADVGQLVVQQCLLVLTYELTELTLKPGSSSRREVQRWGLGCSHPQGTLGGAAYRRLATAWMWVSRCILKV